MSDSTETNSPAYANSRMGNGRAINDAYRAPPVRELDKARWNLLMERFKLYDCSDTFNLLDRAYSERHRAYHTATHINACLQQLDDATPLPVRQHEIEMAIWFHDAIYKPKSQANELDSANWCAGFLSEQLIEKHIVERIHRLILITEHNATPRTLDEFILADIDLAILGSDKEHFEQYDQEVRFEYKWVPGLIYKRKRKQVLEQFLNRDFIFHLEYFRCRFEDQARENLIRTIAKLK